MKSVYCMVLLLAAFPFGNLAPSAARAGQTDEVLARGNPPLTRSVVFKSVELLEWALDVRLSPEQKSKIQQVLINSWLAGRRAEMNITLEMVRIHDQLSQMAREQRDAIRGQLKAALLESLRKEPVDEISRILLSAVGAAEGVPGPAPSLAKNSRRVAADEFAGIYRLIRPTMVDVGIVIEYVTFLPGGDVYWSLPAGGLLYFNPAEARRARPDDWGTYEVRDGAVHILRGPDKRPYVMRIDAEGLRNPPALGRGIYHRMPPADGLRLEGTYRYGETGPSVTFWAGGRFNDEGAFRYSGYTREDGTKYQDDGVGGSGTYLIEQNTLELRYSDGRVKRFAFLAYPNSLAKKPAVDYFSINWNEIMKRQ